ncbi:SAM-dependent methyltransferase [Citricoccus sp.]|uniref:class I SAM-dependent methyltransferase n=1 Tax=Citricoccus sp. TaxID=1978372 RepID=UPI002C5A37EE|nr:SAM-dependent methyltransferase [Citricoccus sp.]HRO94210.1 SAM-dependent methyltransferase [Citricoccus sp.]
MSPAYRRYRGRVASSSSSSPAPSGPQPAAGGAPPSSSAAPTGSRDVTVLAPVLTPEGWQLLNSLEGYRESEALAMSTRLRAAGHAPELVSAVLTQLKLRDQAAAKFGPFAAHMVFTRAGLEQATRMNVAAVHAGRFAGAGIRSVADLGCGLGADAMAMAALDLEVTAVERDETVAAAATINLMPFPHATVVSADAQDWVAAAQANGTEPGGYWLDPARRVLSTSGSSRVFDPEAFSPPLSFVESLAARGTAVGVKLGPGLPHESVPAGCEAQWVSVDGDVTEAVLWFNALARDGVRRSALVMSGPGAGTTAAGGRGGHHELTAGTRFGGSPEVPVGGVEALTGYLYEPDGAVIRAGLVADLIHRDFASKGGALLDEHIAYFRADEPVASPFARAYRIESVMPFNVKGLRRWVRETGVGRLDIKKRGMAVTPEELRRQLMSGKGSKGAKGSTSSRGSKSPGRHATLVLTRIGEERVAVEVTPA